MVALSHAFSGFDDRLGSPAYAVTADDFDAAAALYDRLQANFSGLSVGFYPEADREFILASSGKALADGKVLSRQLDAVSNRACHAYVADLNGRYMAVLIDYAQQPARRDGPPFGQDSDGSHSRMPDRRHMLMETNNRCIKSVSIAPVTPLVSKNKLCAFQVGRCLTLSPNRASPAQLQRVLQHRLTRFTQRAAQLG